MNLSAFKEYLIEYGKYLGKLPEDLTKKEFVSTLKNIGNNNEEVRKILATFDFELLKEITLNYSSKSKLDREGHKELVAKTVLDRIVKKLGDSFTIKGVIEKGVFKEKYKDKIESNLNFLVDKGVLLKDGTDKGAHDPLFISYTIKSPSFNEDYFSESYREDLEKEIKKYKKFVITTAVVDKPVDVNFYNSIKNYAKRNNALVLVLPSDIKNTTKKEKKVMELDPRLKDFKIVFKDTNGESRDLYLNANLCLCSVKTSAKQLNPPTGLPRIATGKDSSIIIGATKLFEMSIPTWKGEVPKRLLTTGAITVGNYATEKYMSQRTSYLAEEDHMLGAVVVELLDNNFFFARQVEGSKEGAFTDLGVSYNPDGTITHLKDNVMVLGDIHTERLDRELFYSVMNSTKDLKVNEVVLHDMFNGTSVSHHDKGKNLDKAMKAMQGRLNLEKEGRQICKLLELTSNYVKNIVVVRSNHDTHLDKYLNTTQYLEDYENSYIAHILALAYMEGKNTLQCLVEEVLETKIKGIKWLKQDESYKRYGAQLGAHGDKGANGAKGSLESLEKWLGNCVIGHSHTGKRIRKACSVGMVGELDQSYNEGLSNWSRTCCLCCSDGTKQLIHFIPMDNGKYEYCLRK